MKRFHVGEFSELKFSKAVRKQTPIRVIKVDESFEAGTATGIQSGSKGDYLCVIGGTFKVISASDFEANYDMLAKEKEEKAVAPKKEKVAKADKVKKGKK